MFSFLEVFRDAVVGTKVPMSVNAFKLRATRDIPEQLTSRVPRCKNGGSRHRSHQGTLPPRCDTFRPVYSPRLPFGDSEDARYLPGDTTEATLSQYRTRQKHSCSCAPGRNLASVTCSSCR